jgi:hypothetical protein
MKVILAYLLIGSYGILWRQWRCPDDALGRTSSPEGAGT